MELAIRVHILDEAMCYFIFPSMPLVNALTHLFTHHIYSVWLNRWEYCFLKIVENVDF